METEDDNIISPLRYPGSKQALVDYVIRFLDANDFRGREWVEPCAGGASVALSLLSRGAVCRATIVEKDPLVYAFWKCLKTQPALLCHLVHGLNITLETWNQFQKYRSADALKKYPLIELALAGLFFNRANYSGIIGANPIGGMSQSSDYKIDCRFTKSTVIDRMIAASLVMDKMTVVRGDVVSYLRRNSERLIQDNSVVYVDPPYVLQGKKLYRHHFKTRDHMRLAEFLNAAPFPWLVSYDNVPFVVELFRGQKVRPIWLKYTVRRARRADELLITNQDHLPRPAAHELLQQKQQKAKRGKKDLLRSETRPRAA
jgi:DNA adenine methylase